MTGHWVVEQAHRCHDTRPAIGHTVEEARRRDVNVGDVWQCECGRRWEVGEQKWQVGPSTTKWIERPRPNTGKVESYGGPVSRREIAFHVVAAAVAVAAIVYVIIFR